MNNLESRHIEPLEARRLLALIGLDLSFGNGTGVISNVLGQDSHLHRIAVIEPIAGGKFLAAGNVAAGGVAIARLNADGSHDTSFGNGDGIDEAEFAMTVRDALLQPDGKLLVVGRAGGGGVGAGYRFNADGTPDTSFGGGDGFIEFPQAIMEPAPLIAEQVARQADGKIVIAGTRNATVGSTKQVLVLTRLNADGSADPTFGTGGMATFEANADNSIAVNDLVIESDGGILFGGAVSRVLSPELPSQAYVARYNADGTPDTTHFSSEVYPGFHLPGNDVLEGLTTVSSLALVPGGGGGDFLIGGLTTEPDIGIASGAIARFNADGSPDTSFGDNGVTRNLGAHPVIDLRVLSDGKIAAAGDAQGLSIAEAYRLLASGAPDPDFDEDGIASASMVAGATAFAVADDGDALLAGFGSIVRAGARPDQFLSVGGTLQVTGTNGDDNISITRSGDNVVLDRNGTITNFPAASVLELDVDLGAGDDQLLVDFKPPRSSGILTGAGSASVTLGDGDFGINTFGPLVLRAGDANINVQVIDGAADIIVGNGLNFIWTDDFDDTIVAGSGGNAIIAQSGNDSIRTGDAIDKIHAGEGEDTVVAGGDDDRIWGEGGRDSLYGGAGRDVILGGASADFIHGGGGNDRLAGQGGNDRIYGGRGDDALDGGAHHDRLFGQLGNDKLFGATASGIDTLVGGEGIDSLFGGAEDEVFDDEVTP